MTEPEGAAQRASTGQALMPRAAAPAPEVERLAQWSRKRAVLLIALLMIVAQLIWKARLLHGLYFVRDDFHDLDLAIEHPLNWSYLTYIWDGHLIIGLWLVAWLLVKTSLYNWGLASAVTLAFTAAASLACYRALRTLFGDGPRILIPLVFYLLTPLTIATFAWWSSAMESVPLQLAIFMAVTSHVLYVRTGRIKHLVAAAFWVAFGLIFFEKALVLPLLLFAVTAGFLVTRRNLLDGARTALRRFWPAWAVYLLLMVGYAVVLAVALRSSIAQPQAPQATGGVALLVGDLLKDSFLPGAFGGPWQWYPVTSFVLAGAPPFLEWVSVVAAVIVIGVSVVARRTAWLAWATLLGWIFAADLLPLVIGRISTMLPALLGLDIRYVADAAPVAAICIGLAFWPVVGVASAARSRPRQAKPAAQLRLAAAGLVGVFIIGSIWSVQQLGHSISGTSARSYIANATEAVGLAPNGTDVYDWPVPDSIAPAVFGRYSHASAVIGDLDIGKLHWLTKLRGTVDNLAWFGADGKLYQVLVGPTSSILRPKGRPCWPQRKGRIVIRFASPTSAYTWILRFGYLLGPSTSAVVSIRYGQSVKYLTVQPGLHAAFLPERGGNVTKVTIGGLGATPMCIGDAEAGNVISSPFSKPTP
ncbi:MAG TPA: hypothetical protein VN695_17515 [Streptosporangiaceae bacterium]|nr:hypothetical protein [Streptosporangiaceae bacterium]